MTKPEIGSLWRRKSNRNFIVKVTKISNGYIWFVAVDRKPRQPGNGTKWGHYWHDAFEPADTPDPKSREVTDAEVSAAHEAFWASGDVTGGYEAIRAALEAVEKGRMA